MIPLLSDLSISVFIIKFEKKIKIIIVEPIFIKIRFEKLNSKFIKNTIANIYKLLLCVKTWYSNLKKERTKVIFFFLKKENQNGIRRKKYHIQSPTPN